MNKHIVSAVIIVLGALAVAGCNKACVDKDVLEPKVQRVLCVDAVSQKLIIDAAVDPKTLRRPRDGFEYVDVKGQKWSWFVIGLMPCAVTDVQPAPAPAPPASPAPSAPTDAGPVQSDAGPPSKR